MKIKDVNIGYEVWYRPTKRHRKNRVWRRTTLTEIEVTEPKQEEFPVAFIVHDYRSVYEGVTDYHGFNGNGDYKLLAEEIRMYKGNLYKAVRISYGTAVSTVFESIDYIKFQLSHRYVTDEKQPKDFTDESIVTGITRESYINSQQEYADKNFLVFGGKVWERCGEPYYTYNTFGLGNNHGGTAFFIQECTNLDTINSTSFNALDREKAIERAVSVALGRGDTNDVNRIKNTDKNIEVLIPEAVKIRSRAEYEAENAKKKAFEEKKVKLEFSIAELRLMKEGLENNYSFELANKVKNIIETQEQKRRDKKC